MCSKYICHDDLVANVSYDFLWSVFNTKATKVCYTITINIKNYPVYSYGFILIKIEYFMNKHP